MPHLHDTTFSWMDTPLKYGTLCVNIYTLFLSVYPKAPVGSKRVKGLLSMLLPFLGMVLLRPHVEPLHLQVMVTLVWLGLMLYFHLRPREALVYTLICCGVGYAAMFVGAFLSGVIGVWYCELVLGSYEKADAVYESLPAHMIMAGSIVLLQCGIVALFLRPKRLKSGISNLIQYGKEDVGVYLIGLFLTVMTLFNFLCWKNILDVSNTILFAAGMACIMAMYFSLRWDIRQEYVRRSNVDSLALLEKSLAEKERQLVELREENDRLAGMMHMDNKLIPAMVQAVRQCAEECRGHEPDGLADKALAIAAELDDIYRRRSAAAVAYEANARQIPSMGAVSTDAIVAYLARRAKEDGTDFTVELPSDSGTFLALLDKAVERRDLNVLLAELTENALLAARENGDTVGRKAVRLVWSEGEDGICLQVSDSGKPFDPKVLQQMGRRRITTRCEKGGSGMGLMNVARLLSRYGAKFTVTTDDETMSPFVKTVCVQFDVL